MSTENQWIKKGDSTPTFKDFPVWFANMGTGKVWGLYYFYDINNSENAEVTHWKRAKLDIPAPPLRPIKQEEKDLELFLEWNINEAKKLVSADADMWHYTNPHKIKAWLAARATLREELLKEFARLFQILPGEPGLLYTPMETVTKFTVLLKDN